jgi:hypothetical protein
MRAGGALGVAVALGFLGTWTGPSASEPDSATLEWRKALALYKQKKFDAACPLFESAAKAKQKNGAIWGDLGLCELKRGDVAASIHASNLAARFGDDSVRQAAYYNLGLASASIALPSYHCITVLSTPDSGCSKPAFACVETWEQYGTGVGQDGNVLYLSDSHEKLQQHVKEMGDLYGDPGDPPEGRAFSRNQRCFSWCARHPEYHCTDDCDEGELLSCSVVFVDACQRRAGYVCTEWESVNGPKHVSAGEIDFSEE